METSFPTSCSIIKPARPKVYSIRHTFRGSLTTRSNGRAGVYRSFCFEESPIPAGRQPKAAEESSLLLEYSCDKGIEMQDIVWSNDLRWFSLTYDRSYRMMSRRDCTLYT